MGYGQETVMRQWLGSHATLNRSSLFSLVIGVGSLGGSVTNHIGQLGYFIFSGERGINSKDRT